MSRDLVRTGFVGRKADELQNDEIADEHTSSCDLGIEPRCEPWKAAISRPRPYSRVEQGRTLQRERFDLSLAAQ